MTGMSTMDPYNVTRIDDNLMITSPGPQITASIQAAKVLFAVIIAVASIVGVGGNILTLASLLLIKANRTAINVFVMNLALADLFVTAVVMPSSASGVLLGQAFYEKHEALCIFLASICAPGCVASRYSICWIAISRYYYICQYPTYLKFFTPRNMCLIVIGIWCLGAVIYLPYHVGWGYPKYNSAFMYCTIDTTVRSYSVFFGCSVIVGFFITFYFYRKIYQIIRKSNHARKRITGVPGNYHMEETPEENRLLSEIKLIKTSFKIFVFYMLSWIPVAILYLMGIDSRIPTSVYVIGAFVAHANSTWNFFIYYFDNDNFRRNFKTTFNRLLRKRNRAGSFYEKDIQLILKPRSERHCIRDPLTATLEYT